jgi:hypothetical protein
VDIEEAGGAALSTGLGLAGATDLDIVRNPLLSKAPYLGRGMIHKVFALSKDKIENDHSFLSLFDELPRVVWRFASANSACRIFLTLTRWARTRISTHELGRGR